MEVAQLKKLKELKAEVAQYKRIVAEQTLPITVLKDVIKETQGPTERRQLLEYATQEHKMSTRQALKMFSIYPSVYYYKPKPNEDHIVREQLSELARIHNRWGFWMMHGYLRDLNYLSNHKRVYRIYTEMGLNLRRKHRKRLPARVMEPLLWPINPNITWSMDFVHDTLNNGVNFRTLNVIDDHTREGLLMAMDTSLTSKRVIVSWTNSSPGGAHQRKSGWIMARSLLPSNWLYGQRNVPSK